MAEVRKFTTTMFAPPGMCSISVGGMMNEIPQPNTPIEVPSNLVEDLKSHGLRTKPFDLSVPKAEAEIKPPKGVAAVELGTEDAPRKLLSKKSKKVGKKKRVKAVKAIEKKEAAKREAEEEKKDEE